MDDDGARPGRGRGRASSPHHGDRGDAAGLQANFRALIGVAMVEAANRGAAAVEAEHLLLGFLFDRTGRGTAVLAEAGLTYAAFDAALANEREKTLAAVGVALPELDRLVAAPRSRGGRTRFGTSAKDAWNRAGKDRQKNRIRGRRWFDIDLMIGILTAELGTVPRALVRAGFDRAQLIEALRAARARAAAPPIPDPPAPRA